MRRGDGEDDAPAKSVSFSVGGTCDHCGAAATTMPACSDSSDPILICQACVIEAFRMVSDERVRGEN